LRVHIVVFDGMDDLDVVGPFSVLGMAARAGLGVEVGLTALSGSPATTRGGLPLHPEPWAPEEADVLIVPGGGYASGENTGVRAEIASAAGNRPPAISARTPVFSPDA